MSPYTVAYILNIAIHYITLYIHSNHCDSDISTYTKIYLIKDQLCLWYQYSSFCFVGSTNQDTSPATTQELPPTREVRPQTPCSQAVADSCSATAGPLQFPRPARRVLLPSTVSCSTFDLDTLRPLRHVDSQRVLYSCPVCAVQYAGHDSACTHIRVAHVNHVIECSVCGRLYKSVDSAKKHFKKFH